MRLAVYNVENLFNRAKVMNQTDWDEGRLTLTRFAELNALLGEGTYTPAMKTKMVTLLKELGLEKSDRAPEVELRRNRGALVKRSPTAGLSITANGRADWVGSLELVDAPINHESMLNTARVIRDVNADVLAIVEAEHRPALKMFNDEIVSSVGGTPYAQVMLIDGNDARGIDVGLVTRTNYTIGTIRSHVDDLGASGEPIFSRDCPEYSVTLPGGNEMLVLVNHLKSKGFGPPARNNARRKAQATRIRELYDQRMSEGYDLIAVVGDLNDTPGSDPLSPLLMGSSLQDIFTHPNFDHGGYPGTYGLCNAANKIDYVLLSPELYSGIEQGGVWRQGMWPGSRPARWQTYPELTKPVEAGSDHACLWVDLDL